MDFPAYQELFQSIMSAPDPSAPYDNPSYMNYVRLNWSRQQRWLKSGVLDPALTAMVKNIPEKQTWLIITEPWCGDAAHIIPFLHRLGGMNPRITFEYQLRDSAPYLIQHYLTRDAKSIPKFIIRNEAKTDLAVWGPRPAGCQIVYDRLLQEHADDEQKKIALQKWYNADKGVSLQAELLLLFRQTADSRRISH